MSNEHAFSDLGCRDLIPQTHRASQVLEPWSGADWIPTIFDVQLHNPVCAFFVGALQLDKRLVVFFEPHMNSRQRDRRDPLEGGPYSEIRQQRARVTGSTVDGEAPAEVAGDKRIIIRDPASFLEESDAVLGGSRLAL